MWRLCPLRVRRSVRIVPDACGLSPALVPYPLVLPSKPGFNYERSKWENGCAQDYGAGPDCPSGWFAGEVEQEAQDDEENAVDKARDVDGLFMPLDSLEDDRAIEQDEVGDPFK